LGTPATPSYQTPDIDDESAAKLIAIEAGGLRVELKYIDRNFNGQGQAYHAETFRPGDPGADDWSGQFAVCLVSRLQPKCPPLRAECEVADQLATLEGFPHGHARQLSRCFSPDEGDLIGRSY